MIAGWVSVGSASVTAPPPKGYLSKNSPGAPCHANFSPATQNDPPLA